LANAEPYPHKEGTEHRMVTHPVLREFIPEDLITPDP
jgi:hypothetical protein